jgi:hypothetical protein
VTKKVYDNLKDFSDRERFGIFDSHGKNLRDRIKEYVAEHVEDAKKSLGLETVQCLEEGFPM